MCNDKVGSSTFKRILSRAHVFAVRILLLPIIAFVTNVDATTFDEKVSAPKELSGPELKTKARAYFAVFEDGSVTPLDVTRDRAKHAEWFDLKWQLGRAIDGKRALDELAEYGVISEGNDRYSVDLERFPQWDPLEAKMRSLLSLGLRDSTLAALKQRGFRDSDVDVLREYLRSNNPDLRAIAETTPLTESFAVRVKKRAARGQRLNVAEMTAYAYQMSRAVKEVYRAWAVGVLDALDAQHQRILVSYVMESGRVMGIAASDPQEGLQYMENFLLSGEYARAAEGQIRAIQREEEKAEGRQ